MYTYTGKQGGEESSGCQKLSTGNSVLDTLNTFTANSVFRVKKAYGSFLPLYQKVPWKNLTMVKGLVARHQLSFGWLFKEGFLLWIDQVSMWLKNVCCVLLKHTHLFFDCSYSRSILLNWLDMSRQVGCWKLGRRN